MQDGPSTSTSLTPEARSIHWTGGVPTKLTSKPCTGRSSVMVLRLALVDVLEAAW